VDGLRALEAALCATYVHPFDDVAVIAGQATVGLEILRQHGAAPLPRRSINRTGDRAG
jgi:threonine dehydratase